VSDVAPLRLARIVSGGQTGVDRAALDAAQACGLPSGGWCPAGRGAEDGPIPERYPLAETPSADPAQRTAWNARDSDATLILSRAEPRGGTALAAREARRLGRPLREVRLGAALDPAEVARTRTWLAREGVAVLNVAGPRESEEPGIAAAARHFMVSVLRG
jgi:hypothetical protein